MCGIAGIYCLNPGDLASLEIVERMTNELVHRGPDESGFHGQGEIALGFRRLSIIDLQQGNQPHFNEDRSIVSICNGEIYNYKEIRRRLESKGHCFRSHCDVEVLVHLYEEDDLDFLPQLNGQFAFALYDRKKRILLLARDPVGITPLFYTRCGRELLFASEIKAILAHPAVERKVNLTGLDQIITFPGLVSPATLFEGIHSIAPGHALLIRDGRIQDHEYWDLVYPEQDHLADPASESASIALIENELMQSVRYRLHADVPVGFYLSGGLDSSLLAALIHTLSPDEIRHSYSITFPDKAIDERIYQMEMAKRVQSIHHETEFHAEDILLRLRKAIWHTECPIKESYDTCSLALSQLVQDTGLKVVLTGEGADELFGGYVGYRLDETRRSEEADPFDINALLEQEIRERLWGDPSFFYEKNYYDFQEQKRGMYSEPLRQGLSQFDSTQQPLIDVKKIRNRHPFHQRSYLDFKLRIGDHLVADHGDRVAYAHSVEARYPFLDSFFINQIRGIHPSLMIRDATEKYLLRQVAKRYVPSSILKREKFGFVAPGSPYLLEKKMDWIEDLLSPETIRRQGYFDPIAVERLKGFYSQGGMTINTTFEQDWLMIILTFGIFLETFSMPNAS